MAKSPISISDSDEEGSHPVQNTTVEDRSTQRRKSAIAPRNEWLTDNAEETLSREERDNIISNPPLSQITKDVYGFVRAIENNRDEDLERFEELLGRASSANNALEEKVDGLRELLVQENNDNGRLEQKITDLKAKLKMTEAELENAMLIRRALLDRLKVAETTRETNGNSATQQLNQTVPSFPPCPIPAKSLRIKLRDLPTFDGKPENCTLTAISEFIQGLSRHFIGATKEQGWVESETKGSWGSFAVLQLRGPAAEWGDDNFPAGSHVDWDEFVNSLKTNFIPADALVKLQLEWERLRIGRNESVTTFNQRFNRVRRMLANYKSLPESILRMAYESKIGGNAIAAEKLWLINCTRPDIELKELMDQMVLHEARAGKNPDVSIQSHQDTFKKPKDQGLTKYNALRRTEGKQGKFRCWMCEEQGHAARDCPQKDEFQKFIARKHIKTGGSKSKGARKVFRNKPKEKDTDRSELRRTEAKKVDTLNSGSVVDSGSDSEVILSGNEEEDW